METIDNIQSTTFNVNKSNICIATETYSTLGLSPNQPIIQYSEGSAPHIPPSSHVSVSTLINILDLIARNRMYLIILWIKMMHS